MTDRKESNLRSRVAELARIARSARHSGPLESERVARRLAELKLARIEAALAHEEPLPGAGDFKAGDMVRFSFQPDGPTYEAAIVSGGSVWLYDKRAGDYLPGAFDWYQLRRADG